MLDADVALPVIAPENPVAVRIPVEGTKLNFEEEALMAEFAPGDCAQVG